MLTVYCRRHLLISDAASLRDVCLNTLDFILNEQKHGREDIIQDSSESTSQQH
jgi:hypothetical protein